MDMDVQYNACVQQVVHISLALMHVSKIIFCLRAKTTFPRATTDEGTVYMVQRDKDTPRNFLIIFLPPMWFASDCALHHLSVSEQMEA
jgi:hypothetical protein